MAEQDKKKYSYDMACEDLARSFLEDDRAQIKDAEFDSMCCDLAQEIQTVIEDFISIERVGARWKSEPPPNAGDTIDGDTP